MSSLKRLTEYSAVAVLMHWMRLDRTPAQKEPPPWTETPSKKEPPPWTETDVTGKKRLFVCCDGTWKNASGTIAPPTNVARLARSVDRYGWEEDRRVPQLVYYAGGVGTHSVLPVPVDYIYSGMTGKGLEKDILNAYCFLCNNFNFASDEDEIILVGFSRGAFTVRCLASFIDQIGLIRRRHLSLLPTIFKNWCANGGQIDEKYRSAEISLSVRIRVLAEWDTVSALWGGRFRFVRNEVPSVVDNAFLAVALDEWRWSFQPELWMTEGEAVAKWTDKPPRDERRIEQMLFAGSHSDIGGGNADSGLSTVALLWMISRIQAYSEARFDKGTLLQPLLPLTSSDSPTSRPKVEYENILMAPGRVNTIPAWWSLTQYISLGLFNGDRGARLRQATLPDRPLRDTFDVHFTVPLLDGRRPESPDESSNMPRQVQLRNRMGFAWPDPSGWEIDLLKAWNEAAQDWANEYLHPQSESSDRIEDVRRINRNIKLQVVLAKEEPLVFRLFQELNRWDNTRKLFHSH